MRTTFANSLLEIASSNKNIMLLTGDLGYSVFESFQAELPKQYLNMGVAEQNMTGVAAGMALEGKIPIIYSIAPFVTMRNFEQIRNDICYQNANVKIVGVGAGFSYAAYGHTHHGLEDLGILRTLPNLTIVAPGDPVEARLATIAMLKQTGPCYLRLGKAGEPNVHTDSPHFVIGKGIVMSRGNDFLLIAISTLLGVASLVIQALEKCKFKGTLVSMHTLKPLDADLILSYLKKTPAIFTLEEHSIIGGLGSAVAEIIAESGQTTKFKRLAVPDKFTKVMGRKDFMLKANGLEKMQIVKQIIKTISK